MAILGQNMENLAQELWKYMEKMEGQVEGDGLKLEGVITTENTRKENLLLMCSARKQFQLFVDICSSEKLSKKSIQEGLSFRNADGLGALDL